jgi:hypothetical protein
MKGGSSLTTRKGSILYVTLVLIFAANLALKNHRLLMSHMFLERGIYSLDERLMDFGTTLDEIEGLLQEKFVDYEAARAFFSTEKIIYHKNFSIYGQDEYNGSVFIKVYNNSNQHVIEVEILYVEGKFILKTRGV